ncbi:hypothetical protein [Sulfuriflexus mobilis]|uniref:hypothetical protein n=1 Tax=Sulfuriflexus mobilis TaxID=1811807 RepID=UPI0018D55A4C|nr:hypothetical protein [Sulfuriflexus mobilis]
MLKLLLPALLPSWRFFDVIAPSPRVQFTLLGAEDETPREWHEFRPRPAQLSFLHMLGRMFWNPQWNESLFMVSCAERLMEYPMRHSEDEILNRIIQEVMARGAHDEVKAATHLQFRLLRVRRQGSQLQEEVAFHSRIQPLPVREAA